MSFKDQSRSEVKQNQCNPVLLSTINRNFSESLPWDRQRTGQRLRMSIG